MFEDEHEDTERDEDQLTVPNQLDCLVRLQLGEVDAVVTDNALAAGQAAQDPAVELKGDEPFTTEYYGVAAKLGADDLVARVNHVLDGYRRGGANSPWMTSYRTWLAEGLPGIEGPPRRSTGATERVRALGSGCWNGEVIDGRGGILPRIRGEAPGPVMGRDEADRTLARLGAEHEAIETSLLALEEHAGHAAPGGRHAGRCHRGALGFHQAVDHVALAVLRRVRRGAGLGP